MNIVAPLLFAAVAVYVLALVEIWSVEGRFRLTAPLTAAVALIGTESVHARKSDRVFFESAPVLLLVAAVLALAVIPLGPGLIITDLATGALFLNAALAYVLVALIMAGWGPDGAYGLVAGWRFLGQAIAYAMLVVMPITAVAMRAESLAMTDIVTSQQSLWNIVYQPLGFVLFVVAGMGLCFLPPFDLPIAAGELAGGVEAEYTGVRLGVFRLARTLLVVTVAGATTTFYLGGWLGPVLPPWAWSGLKILSVSALMIIGGRWLPRVREAQYLALCWKVGIPLALLNIFIVGVVVVAVAS